MNYERDNETAKVIFEFTVWSALLFFSYVTLPVLIIVVLATMLLSYKLSANSKLLKQQLAILQRLELQNSTQTNQSNLSNQKMENDN